MRKGMARRAGARGRRDASGFPTGETCDVQVVRHKQVPGFFLSRGASTCVWKRALGIASYGNPSRRCCASDVAAGCAVQRQRRLTSTHATGRPLITTSSVSSRSGVGVMGAPAVRERAIELGLQMMSFGGRYRLVTSTSFSVPVKCSMISTRQHPHTDRTLATRFDCRPPCIGS